MRTHCYQNVIAKAAYGVFACLLCMFLCCGVALANDEYASDEILVVYESDATNSSSAQTSEPQENLQNEGFNVVEEIPTNTLPNDGDAVVAQIPPSMDVEEAVAVAQATEGVAYAQPNYVYRLDEEVMEEAEPQGGDLFEALATINDSYYVSNKDQFANLSLHKLLSAWDKAKTEHAITVVVIDTGCRLSHLDLVNNLDTANAWDFGENRDQPLTTSVSQGVIGNNGDDIGHGTHVCGIIAAEANNGRGIAGSSYNATIIPINVFELMYDEEENDYYYAAYTSTLWKALDKVAELHEQMPEVKVVNMSLGGSGSDSHMSRQITQLANMGVLCVCAAGNEDTTSTSFPADSVDAFSVMALDNNGSHTYYTNYKTGSSINTAKTVSAVGGGGNGSNDMVLSTYASSDSSYARMCGTSMATPLVSGVAALVWSVNPSLSTDAIKAILTSTATSVNSSSTNMTHKDAATSGSIDADQAVQAAQATNTGGGVAVEFSKTYVNVPTAVQGLTYSGVEQTGVAEGEDYTLSGTVAATGAGTYTATASLVDTLGCVWADGSTTDKTITWTIAPAQLTATFEGGTIQVGQSAPTTVVVTGFVNGETDKTAAGYVGPTANVSGVNVRTPGKYDVTPAGGSATNYAFAYAGGSVVVMGTVNEPVARTGLVYTGSLQTGVPASVGYTLTGETSATAGTHTATATPTTYYTWNDGSTDPKQISWNIAQATLTARYTGGVMHVGDAVPANIEVTGFVNGETAATAAGYVAPTVTITPEQRSTPGVYSIAPSGGSATNYAFTYKQGTLEVTNKTLVDAPVAASGLQYNGKVQVGVGVKAGNTLVAPAANAGYTVTNASAANAGTYTSVARLADGYMWADGTTDNKTFTWSISATKLVATYGGGSIWAGASAPTGVTVTGFVNGETAATAAGYKAPTVSISSAVRSALGVHTITPAGGSATNYTFTYTSGKLSVFGKAANPTVKTLTYNKAAQVGVLGGTGFNLSGTTKATNVGTYTAKATLKANYKWSDGSTGVKTLTWKITPCAITYASVGGIATQAYTSKAITPTPAVSHGGATLRKGVDYTLSYANNVKAGTATITITGKGNYNWSRKVNFRIVAPSVRYRTHVQTYGNQAWRYDGAMSGTSGQAKRLEGIWIELPSMPVSGGIQYRTHVQKIGWQDWRNTGAMSGTSGRALRLEAIQIRLTGNMANKYDVYYRVHAQKVGWMGWAKNGAQSGTAAYARRLEGIQVVLVPKGAAAPGATYGGITQNTNKPFMQR